MAEDPDLDLEGDAERLFQELFGEKPLPQLPADRPLDDVFASRTHVRVLRVLIALDRHLNLSGRGVAARAGVARARVLAVLRHLASIGVVTTTWTPEMAIYRADDRSALMPALRSLFLWERELKDTPPPGSP